MKNSRASTHYADRDNCELSDRDSRELDANNPMFFEHTGESDFYERFGGRAGSECLDGKGTLLLLNQQTRLKLFFCDYSEPGVQ